MSENRAWTWRHAIIKSSLPATTRHVLLTISCFMNELGDGCYPTQEQIAEATGLSDRAVRTHLELAEKEGWIKRSEHGFRGQKWRNHQYVASWPETQHVDEGAELASGASDQGAEGRSSKVRNVVPKGAEGRSDYQSSNQSKNQSTSDARARREGDFNILWKEWPEKSRPDSQGAARAIFHRLSKTDQSSAVTFAADFCRAKTKDRPMMIPYLQERQFADFVDGPPVDKDGDFVITPDRMEWIPWLEDIRASHGERGAASVIRSGRMVRKSRWPIGRQKAA